MSVGNMILGNFSKSLILAEGRGGCCPSLEDLFRQGQCAPLICAKRVPLELFSIYQGAHDML